MLLKIAIFTTDVLDAKLVISILRTFQKVQMNYNLNSMSFILLVKLIS